jgi:hypothetical protein
MANAKPYGVAIQEAVASGELARMKQAAKLAEAHVKEHGNVAAALEALKIEIAKLQAKPAARAAAPKPAARPAAPPAARPAAKPAAKPAKPPARP